MKWSLLFKSLKSSFLYIVVMGITVSIVSPIVNNRFPNPEFSDIFDFAWFVMTLSVMYLIPFTLVAYASLWIFTRLGKTNFKRNYLPFILTYSVWLLTFFYKWDLEIFIVTFFSAGITGLLMKKYILKDS
ncbi:hypothetical protein KRX57_03975 [Weeksellaceae bacterium TAE3-ERU29]|nr:hypothetical protein [Weeksellaceae bacterium TAE3-ERU29]